MFQEGEFIRSLVRGELKQEIRRDFCAQPQVLDRNAFIVAGYFCCLALKIRKKRELLADDAGIRRKVVVGAIG